MKYIWFTKSGREQLFDIEKDYSELVDLSRDKKYYEESFRTRKEESI